ncbi:tumor necrosis factor receptor superfamily member 16-like isoform X2 [Mya arenaria]|uniref:tumor necrosis factor receptor superfamily member 16-like isoform X2 n=1 Tax=Mya arenaria TaxID=6604 RepID=UPI0022E0F065|nr:tumor necrosis factor receptor superfamily member 16-like isoform X2 [Mya arenaria]
MEQNTLMNCRILKALNTFKYQFLNSTSLIILHFNFGVEGLQPSYHLRKTPAGDCPVGYFIKNIEQREGCLPCELCPRGFQVNKWCNGTKNTECEPCPIGTFNDATGGACQPCSTCKVGEFIRRKCLPEKDTKCRRCPKGKYSVNGQGFACRPCTGCLESNREEMFPCKSEHDRVCGQCKLGHFSELGGRCLPCSYCGYTSKQKFVPDCAKQKGLEYPNLCWPDPRIRLPYTDSIAPITTFSNQAERGYHNENALIVFGVCIFAVGSILLIFTLLWAMHRVRCRYKLKRTLINSGDATFFTPFLQNTGQNTNP